MGRTVPSFRIALEQEIATWGLYRRALGGASRQALDRMFNRARTYCSASSNAVRPVRFQGMFMAVAYDHERRLDDLESKFERYRLQIDPDSRGHPRTLVESQGLTRSNQFEQRSSASKMEELPSEGKFQNSTLYFPSRNQFQRPLSRYLPANPSIHY